MPEVDRTPANDHVVKDYRGAVRSRGLVADDELPSTRRLAEEPSTAVSTAQRALELLRVDGWLESRPGKPSIVKAQRTPSGGWLTLAASAEREAARRVASERKRYSREELRRVDHRYTSTPRVSPLARHPAMMGALPATPVDRGIR